MAVGWLRGRCSCRGRRIRRRQLHLVRDVPGITNPRRSRACAAIYTGSPSLTFCCSRSAICERNEDSLAANCFISVRCAKYVRTGPAMVSVSTQTTAASTAARRAAKPSR